MPVNLNKNLKVYYSISEVAKMFGVNESTLRYWEKEFPFIKPGTNPTSKVRRYTSKDIEQVKLVYNLVKVRGFKIASARTILNSNRSGADRRAEVLETLMAVRDELQSMKRHLDAL